MVGRDGCGYKEVTDISWVDGPVEYLFCYSFIGYNSYMQFGTLIVVMVTQGYAYDKITQNYAHITQMGACITAEI